MMNAIAHIVLGYLIAQAVILIALALWSECRHPSRTTRRTLASPFSIELN